MKKIKVVCGVIMNSENNYLITQRGDFNNFQKWEFPGGKVESTENIFQSIKRELKEELNIEVAPVKKLLEYDYKEYNLSFIECTLHSKTIVLNEHLNYKWVNIEDFNNFEFLEGDNLFINFLKTKP